MATAHTQAETLAVRILVGNVTLDGDLTIPADASGLALARLSCEKRLEVIAGATHLFEEPGTLQRVAELARD
jgi:hypothetical protein